MLVLFSRASWFYTGLYGCIYGVFSQDSDLHYNEVNLDLPGWEQNLASGYSIRSKEPLNIAEGWLSREKAVF